MLRQHPSYYQSKVSSNYSPTANVTVDRPLQKTAPILSFSRQLSAATMDSGPTSTYDHHPTLQFPALRFPKPLFSLPDFEPSSLSFPNICLPPPPPPQVVRSRDLEVLAPLDIVIDVAGEYDHAKLRYDHHQRGEKDENIKKPDYNKMNVH